MASDTELRALADDDDQAQAQPLPRRPRWQIVVAALGVLMVGYAAGASVQAANGRAVLASANAAAEREKAAADAAAHGELTAVQEELAAMESRAVDAEAEAAQLNAQIDDKLAELDAERDRLAIRSDVIEGRDDALDVREDNLDQRATALNRLEKEAEKRIAMTRIDDGVYEVGVDMEAGLYKAADSSDCYWARLSHNGDDIIANHFASGPAVVTVLTGELFETNGCATFVKQ